MNVENVGTVVGAVHEGRVDIGHGLGDSGRIVTGSPHPTDVFARIGVIDAICLHDGEDVFVAVEDDVGEVVAHNEVLGAAIDDKAASRIGAILAYRGQGGVVGESRYSVTGAVLVGGREELSIRRGVGKCWGCPDAQGERNPKSGHTHPGQAFPDWLCGENGHPLHRMRVSVAGSMELLQVVAGRSEATGVVWPMDPITC